MTTKQTIWLIEDEPAIAETLIYALQTDGFTVQWFHRGQLMLDALQNDAPSLFILDVGLPDINGFDLYQRILATHDVPLLFLTARADEVDRIVGLEMGADDYIAKPFSPREVCARVRGILRRSERAVTKSKTSEVSLFEVNESHGTILFCEQLLSLTRYEFLLLKTLLSEPNRIFPRQLLMDLVWTDATDTFDRTVDTHIKTLRSKLRVVNESLNPITTHRGFGYSIRSNTDV
ncbi:DNA-binding response regulator [Formosimonas limnophila]|uniref:DNA-binding response regulator n=1 Tax=Formosimonas limnophila TaxID=1384487 RepID=A0A8J3G041_9BURK|nr:two-component system response regulator CreB [Formosimonas limnophila]GHA65126.1 DNA-binding response regulator [Formosimonas limnophila]